MAEWARLSRFYPGWTLTEIKSMTRSERANWAGMALTMGG